MKNLLTLTAVIEAGAGLAIRIWPSEAATLLPGSSLDTTCRVDSRTLGRSGPTRPWSRLRVREPRWEKPRGNRANRLDVVL